MANNENNQMDPAEQAEWHRRFPRTGWWLGVLPNHPVYEPANNGQATPQLNYQNGGAYPPSAYPPPAYPPQAHGYPPPLGPPHGPPPGYQALPERMCLTYLHFQMLAS